MEAISIDEIMKIVSDRKDLADRLFPGLSVEFLSGVILPNPYDRKVGISWRYRGSSYDKQLIVYLSSFPGGCGGIVLHDPTCYRGLEKQTSFMLDVTLELIRQKAFVDESWGKMVLASTISSQKSFITWLKKNEFTKTGHSTNPRTDNRMTFWMKDLQRPRKYRTKPQQAGTPVVAPFVVAL